MIKAENQDGYASVIVEIPLLPEGIILEAGGIRKAAGVYTKKNPVKQIKRMAIPGNVFIIFGHK
ncbi:hypothetical protein AGMMS50268_17230 [Spirochaetia bacterium]|nr:hypothetical protein AGMMS50268_17230 [Spirochaetia bacterium]